MLPAKAAGTGAKWFHALLTQGFYQVCRRYPKQIAPCPDKGVQAPAARRATTSPPTSRPTTTRGTSASAPCPTATSSRPSATARRRWSPTTSTRFTETASCSTSGTELEADVIVTATGCELLFLGGIDADGRR